MLRLGCKGDRLERWPVGKVNSVADLSCVDGLLRHIRACQTATLPGERLAFRIGADPVGWVRPALAEALAGFPQIEAAATRITLTAPAALQAIARDLSARGFFRWRNEAFDVRAAADAPVLAVLDRGALPAFGVVAEGVHVNGLVRRADGLHLWIARRAKTKLLDPGKLDHIVAGGVPAGLSPAQTLVKEAAEEAAVPEALAVSACPVGMVHYAMERPEGLRRDRLYCYDLALPEDFTPRPTDGEVEAFELWPITRVLATVRDTDAFKFNVNLVLIDLFLREGLIVGSAANVLRAALEDGRA
jgi:8-oxo-dGTP pyrophosphatase MutT (NUDIX family)